MSWGKIYETTWWGNPTATGWGNIYFNLAQDQISKDADYYQDRVVADGGSVEALSCLIDTFRNTIADGDRVPLSVRSEVKKDVYAYSVRLTNDGGSIEAKDCLINTMSNTLTI